VKEIQPLEVPVIIRSEYIEYIEKHMRERRDYGNINSLDDECNFMSGVMCATTFLTVPPPRENISPMIHPRWIMGPLTGRSAIPFDDDDKRDPYDED